MTGLLSLLKRASFHLELYNQRKHQKYRIPRQTSALISHQGNITMLLQLALSFSLVPMCLAAALTASCGSIYKSFAQCLIMLGDSLVDTQKDQSSQDVDAICRSWNAFHVCASSALAGCPHAAAVWESLRQESRKTQFSGNLYELCDSRTTLAPSTVPVPERQPTPDQTNQETLKGCGFNPYPNSTLLFLPWTSLLMVVLKM